jgi:hypothetical protein
MNNRTGILFSILILLFAVALYFWMDGQGPSDLGALLASFGSFLAIFWFYKGLRLQSLQINEQRQQFVRQIQLQHQDSMLNFLSLASNKMHDHLKELITLLNIPDESHITSCYLSNMQYYKQSLESNDPNAVIQQVQYWMKIEAPCVKFMSAVKDLVLLHQQRLGINNNTEITDPADFVFINSSHLLNQPFMSPYNATVKLLSEQMMLISPGRKAMTLAMSAALCQIDLHDIIKKDKIIQDIKKAQESKSFIPKICEALLV